MIAKFRKNSIKNISIVIPAKFLKFLEAESAEVYFEKLGIKESRRGLMPVLNFLWYVAAKKAGIPVVSEFEIGEHDDMLYIVRDMNVSHFENQSKLAKLTKRSNIIQSTGRVYRAEANPEQLQLAHRMSCVNYISSPGKYMRWQDGWIEWDNDVNDQTQFVVPLGPSESFLPEVVRGKTKTILFDALYPAIIEGKVDAESQIFYGLKKAIYICNQLQLDYGYKISTWCGSEKGRDFLLRLGVKFNIDLEDSWVPYKQILKRYSLSRMFFSHIYESYGLPIYENLCLGNPVICFEEFSNPIDIVNFQNGLKISLNQSIHISAAQIDDFYKSLDDEGIKAIRKQSIERFSADTFGYRLRSALIC